MTNKKIYEIGEIPEIGVVPDEMYAWVIREQRLGGARKGNADRKDACPKTRSR